MRQKSRFQEIRYRFLKGRHQLEAPAPGPRRSRASTGLGNTPAYTEAPDSRECPGIRIATPQTPAGGPNAELRIRAQGRLGRPERRQVRSRRRRQLLLTTWGHR